MQASDAGIQPEFEFQHASIGLTACAARVVYASDAILPLEPLRSCRGGDKDRLAAHLGDSRMSADLTGFRVLVVEDEMMVSMLIEDMLSDLGCLVVGPAARLDEAMVLAKDSEFDCAVLDVNLGGQSIYPLSDFLRDKGAPFAFATGYGDVGLREADRGSLVLQKPFRETDLARVLGELKAMAGKTA
jgi:CheY-like chemotaxis protein